ncbi:MAG TPA: bifunctional 4-hydroxy-2-oxoglutarate aldolase/2-dehydro-3-deoxy-phosphogluconate aldolase [Candidatus Omnitrophota bacterium]|nr:bifunctional 4-hydroxy-2-oxoglutarate aldolase/2-dehydro-3-deoxy-phosphogluconate aldolase [Candidatus Omnitrophota bacterium]HPS37061.1 bifunctional 4-hydroxy-2-oxoglutarate aldolase/2-dehydro-3-deoxy-phosphogluconate aldolase [Candidatus Omnitrophota bacterium]
MDLARFRIKPVLGILRGISSSALKPLLEAIVASGLETVEFAMNSTNAPELIQKAVRGYGKKLMIGAGTVLDLKDLKVALEAGATFIVSPVVVKPVIQYCKKNRIPVFPGALAPQDIYEAWKAGATMVKVFPASCFGPDYFKDIKGPFSQIELLACNGVTPKNMQDYFRSGASAIAVGSSVFRKDWIETGKFNLIRRKLREYLNALP